MTQIESIWGLLCFVPSSAMCPVVSLILEETVITAGLGTDDPIHPFALVFCFPLLLFHPPHCIDLVPIVIALLTMITSFVPFMPKLNAIPWLFLRNLVHSFNIRFCSSSQAAADLGAKPQEVLAVVGDGRVPADHELDVRSVRLGHDADDAVTPLRFIHYFICLQGLAQKSLIFFHI
jgi:hypothetical protein